MSYLGMPDRASVLFDLKSADFESVQIGDSARDRTLPIAWSRKKVPLPAGDQPAQPF
jgi:hypothetical protein